MSNIIHEMRNQKVFCARHGIMFELKCENIFDGGGAAIDSSIQIVLEKAIRMNEWSNERHTHTNAASILDATRMLACLPSCVRPMSSTRTFVNSHVTRGGHARVPSNVCAIVSTVIEKRKSLHLRAETCNILKMALSISHDVRLNRTMYELINRRKKQDEKWLAANVLTLYPNYRNNSFDVIKHECHDDELWLCPCWWQRTDAINRIEWVAGDCTQ